MLLDPETWDLVQHIDSMLARVTDEGEFEAHVAPELMQSVLEITTPVCRTAAEAGLNLRALRSYVGEIARKEGCRFASAGTHPFSLFERQRITAKDRYRRARRPDAVHRPARADLRHAHPRRRRRPGQGDRGPERPGHRTCRSSSRSRPARRSGAASRPGSRRRGRWCSRRSRARACRRGSRATRTTPRSSASSSGRAASRTTRTSGGTCARTRASARSSCAICDAVTRVEDAVALAAYFQALVKLYSEQFDAGREGAELPPHPHRREQVARRALRPRGAA